MTRNSRQSSVLVPTIRSTADAGAGRDPVDRGTRAGPPRRPPAATASMLGTTSWPQRSGSGCARRSAFSSCLRREQPLDGHGGDRLPRRGHAQLLGETVGRSAARSPPRSAWWAAPLWRMARRNSPSARGMESSVPMLIAPADWPKTVTLAGSPPKAAMFSCTHSRAATWSSRPRLAPSSPRYRKPSAPRRQLMTTQTTPSRAKRLPSYAAVDPISNAPPWIHTMTGSPAAPGSGVQTLRFRQSSPRHGGVPVGARALRGSHLGRRRPRGGWRHARPPRARPAGAGGAGSRPTWGGCEGNPEEHVHAVGDAAAQLALDGLHHGTHDAPRCGRRPSRCRGEGPGPRPGPSAQYWWSSTSTYPPDSSWPGARSPSPAGS